MNANPDPTPLEDDPANALVADLKSLEAEVARQSGAMPAPAIRRFIEETGGTGV